jgi:hypothetical protein
VTSRLQLRPIDALLWTVSPPHRTVVWFAFFFCPLPFIPPERITCVV